MKLSAFSALFLCALSITSVLGTCGCSGPNNYTVPSCCYNNYYCREKCYEYTATFTAIQAIIGGGAFAVYTVSGSVYYIWGVAILGNGRISFSYNNSFVIIKANGNTPKYYYYELNSVTNGGCSKFQEFKRSPYSSSTKVQVPNQLIYDAMQIMLQPYNYPCVVSPPTGDPAPANVYETQFQRLRSVKYCDLKSNNSTNMPTQFDQTLNSQGTGNREGSAPGEEYGQYACRYYYDLETNCGVPPKCNPQFTVPPYPELFKKIDGCYDDCMTPKNSDGVVAFTNCICQASAYLPMAKFQPTRLAIIKPGSSFITVIAGFFATGILDTYFNYFCLAY